MPLSMGEKIRIAMSRRGMSIGRLAEEIETTRQNFSNKLSRDNFSEKELHTIAKALNCTFEAKFVMNDTGEEI